MNTKSFLPENFVIFYDLGFARSSNTFYSKLKIKSFEGLEKIVKKNLELFSNYDFNMDFLELEKPDLSFMALFLCVGIIL